VPRYVYRCKECDELSVISHLSDEIITECPECARSDVLVKVLTSFTATNKNISNKIKVGQTTEEFIQDARQELSQQKDELDKNR